MQLKSHRREGTKKRRPATTAQDVVLLVLAVLAALEVLAVLGLAVLWVLNG